jgi:putative ubiquitin-RnfH superfamily antitoxin RatB of RatAB toxin-antitoxin module
MADALDATIEIEIAYAFDGEQLTQTLQVRPGTTVGEAIESSGVLARHPEIAARALKIGIFGRRVAAAATLREYDRIEIYRPLIADPKQARRARARRSGKSIR